MMKIPNVITNKLVLTGQNPLKAFSAFKYAEGKTDLIAKIAAPKPIGKLTPIKSFEPNLAVKSPFIPCGINKPHGFLIKQTVSFR